MALLQVNDISKVLGSFSLKGISFAQQAGQKLAITGESGSGKSTLLKIIAGLMDADEGTVLFEGKKVTGPAYNLVPGHKGIAYLSQHYELRNHYRMEELLAYANELDDKAAAQIYSLCRIDHLLKRKTEGLSGGEKQRIALARLLVSTPKMLILDEPFSNLDLPNKNILKQILQDICDVKGMSCLLTSHDPTDTLPWADELLVLQQGQLIQQGAPAQIYHQPQNEYIAGMLGNYNLLEGKTAALFTDKKAKIIVRPEGICIHKTKEDGVEAMVQQITFAGDKHIVMLSLGDASLHAYTYNSNLSVGDKVYISVNKENIWHL